MSVDYAGGLIVGCHARNLEKPEDWEGEYRSDFHDWDSIKY